MGVSDGELLSGGARGWRMGSILGRGDAITEGKRGKECQDQEEEKEGYDEQRLSTREKQGSSEHSARPLPFHDTRLSAVVALGALFPEPAGR